MSRVQHTMRRKWPRSSASNIPRATHASSTSLRTMSVDVGDDDDPLLMKYRPGAARPQQARCKEHARFHPIHSVRCMPEATNQTRVCHVCAKVFILSYAHIIFMPTNLSTSAPTVALPRSLPLEGDSGPQAYREQCHPSSPSLSTLPYHHIRLSQIPPLLYSMRQLQQVRVG